MCQRGCACAAGNAVCTGGSVYIQGLSVWHIACLCVTVWLGRVSSLRLRCTKRPLGVCGCLCECRCSLLPLWCLCLPGTLICCVLSILGVHPFPGQGLLDGAWYGCAGGMLMSAYGAVCGRVQVSLGSTCGAVHHRCCYPFSCQVATSTSSCFSVMLSHTTLHAGLGTCV